MSWNWDSGVCLPERPWHLHPAWTRTLACCRVQIKVLWTRSPTCSAAHYPLPAHVPIKRSRPRENLPASMLTVPFPETLWPISCTRSNEPALDGSAGEGTVPGQDWGMMLKDVTLSRRGSRAPHSFEDISEFLFVLVIVILRSLNRLRGLWFLLLFFRFACQREAHSELWDVQEARHCSEVSVLLQCKLKSWHLDCYRFIPQSEPEAGVKIMIEYLVEGHFEDRVGFAGKKTTVTHTKGQKLLVIVLFCWENTYVLSSIFSESDLLATHISGSKGLESQFQPLFEMNIYCSTIIVVKRTQPCLKWSHPVSDKWLILDHNSIDNLSLRRTETKGSIRQLL